MNAVKERKKRRTGEREKEMENGGKRKKRRMCGKMSERKGEKRSKIRSTKKFS